MDLTRIVPATATLEGIIAPPTKIPARAFWLQLLPPQSIEWNRFELPVSNLAPGLAGLRILHLSDFHFRTRWPAALDPLLDRIRCDPPDLILLTGDFVDNKRNHLPAMPNVRRLINGLSARAGCFAIHGNHDSYAIGKEFKNSGTVFLDGVRHLIEMPGGNVELIGLPGKHRDELTPNVLASFPPSQAGVLRIVLSHFPDHLRRTESLQPDLLLAGHTHGGQVCLPNGTPIFRHDSLPRALTTGVHRVDNTWLVVNRGIGATGLPIRANCSPEVIDIRCVCAS